ncbi:type II and III secretion system protein family protein [Dechloromonas sp. A34]|uniref:type II and III secretion system protein family protein n=1 Tax=Dechloromonas sp. A34 TaxID=447588 RepID=UPI002248B5EE|nr:type II and III secretion system protein family protein [Dechloromonas sp. A34]
MFRCLIACCCTLLLTTAALPAHAQGGQASGINVAPGSQHPYTHGTPIRRVAVGDPKVAGVVLTSSRSLLITGKQPGSTTLFVWDKQSGPNPGFQTQLVVAPAIDDGGLRVQGAGAHLKLAGTLSSLESHQAALGALREGTKPVDASHSDFDTQVQIDIKVVEVSRKRLMDAGFFLGKNSARSTQAISGPGNLTGIEASSSSGNFTLFSESGFLPFQRAYNLIWGGAQRGLLGALSVLEADGFAYTLAEPSLTAISGQTASFLAGGEIPIPLRTGGGADSAISIRYKEFGIKVALTPTVLDRDRIFLKVAPEVSELDNTLSVQTGGVTVPGLSVRRTETSVALGDGESFVLSGLVSRNTASNVDKFPILGEIPILGAFLRSTRFDRTDKELLMVVTAHLIRPFAKGQALPPLPGENLRNYDPSFLQLMFQEKGRFNSLTGFSD